MKVGKDATLQRTLRRIRRHRLSWRKHNAIVQRDAVERLQRDADDVLEAWGIRQSIGEGSFRARQIVVNMQAKGRQHHLRTGIPLDEAKCIVFRKEMKRKFGKVHRRQRRPRRLKRYIKKLRAVVLLAKLQRRVLRWLWRPDGPMARRTRAHFYATCDNK